MIDRLLAFLGALATIIGGALTVSPTLQLPVYVGLSIVALGLVTAGYSVWAVRNEIDEWLYRLRPKELMPLLELRHLATRHGWNFEEPSLHLLDLKRALDEAGPRGLLKFYARPNADNTALLRDRPRITITPAEWTNLQISPDGFIHLWERDNIKTGLHKRNPFGDKTHSDVYVVRRGVRRWFRVYAREFRGQYETEKVKRSGTE